MTVVVRVARLILFALFFNHIIFLLNSPKYPTLTRNNSLFNAVYSGHTLGPGKLVIKSPNLRENGFRSNKHYLTMLTITETWTNVPTCKSYLKLQ